MHIVLLKVRTGINWPCLAAGTIEGMPLDFRSDAYRPGVQWREGTGVVCQCHRTRWASLVIFMSINHVISIHMLKVGEKKCVEKKRKRSVLPGTLSNESCFRWSDLYNYAEERSRTTHGEFLLLGQLYWRYASQSRGQSVVGIFLRLWCLFSWTCWDLDCPKQCSLNCVHGCFLSLHAY